MPGKIYNLCLSEITTAIFNGKSFESWILIVILLTFSGCMQNKKQETDSSGDFIEPLMNPMGMEPDTTVTLSNNTLQIVFIDNSEWGDEHLPGYNGIARMTHAEQDSNIFVPKYAGFNLEHIFGGDSLTELFEPRKHPMELYKISNNEVLLYQSPTPLSKVESRTHFTLKDPHYIDVEFRFIIHDPSFFKHGYAGLFWASYIQQPPDKKMYFLGRRKDETTIRWIEAYSETHGMNSTHLNKRSYDSIYFADNFNATLASHFSDYLFEQAFFYGQFHNMVLIYMFDRMKGIRFSQSPTGGGLQSPAWDFQFIRPDFKIGVEYSFRARIVYKPFISRDDILQEYETWNTE